MNTPNPTASYASDLRVARDKFNAAARELAKRGCDVDLTTDYVTLDNGVKRVQLSLMVRQRI